MIQTENASPQMKDKCIQHDANSDAKKGYDKPTTSDKDTQTPESFTAIKKCLTEFQDVTAQRLESSFVNAIDNFARVLNNTTDLQVQIRKLTEERDTLKAQKQQISSTPEIKKCSYCPTLISKIEGQENEIKKLKQQMFDINLEKEMAAAKQQAALTVLNQKFE